MYATLSMAVINSRRRVGKLETQPVKNGEKSPGATSSLGAETPDQSCD